MNLYIMRHGKTVWNEKRIHQGLSNNRLSKNGIALTEKVSAEFKNIKFDVIIISPLMRTIQTANIMNKYHNVKIVKDPEIIEIDQGIFTGKYKEKLTSEELALRNRRAPETKMETYEHCLSRCKHFLENIKTKYPYENVLVVTHNVCATFIEDILNNYNRPFDGNKITLNFKQAEIKKFMI